jgi:hypothetical protein
MKYLLSLLMFFAYFTTFGQQTVVFGRITEKSTGLPLELAKIRYINSKIAGIPDSLGNFRIETYYATDSIRISAPEMKTVTFAIKKDVSQEINVQMVDFVQEMDVVVIRPSDEPLSTIIHKRMVANKRINNREKLDAYSYEIYNRLQLDLNNIGDKFGKNKLIKSLDVVMQYLDSTEDGVTFLPAMLTESISQYDYQKNPKKKREVVSASRIAGVDNAQFGQFLGEMYLDINMYDNYIPFFGKSFISPASSQARNFYKFVLVDSMVIDNRFCYQLSFKPKRTGELTFTGNMWIHDTTYAIKQIKADISPGANINYVQGWYIEQYFEQVQPEVWMQVKEKMIVDLKVTESTKVYGFFGRKISTRKNFTINQEKPAAFYRTDETVEIEEGSDKRSDEYWAEKRHVPLTKQEEGIENMIDSLNALPVFKNIKTLTYLLTTGFYQINKIEVGNISSLISYNNLEHLRIGGAIRTSNKFSKRIEFTARMAYGFGDDAIKYGGQIRYNATPKKRGLITAYYNYDIEQLGAASNLATVGNASTTLLRTGPLDKLTFVEKYGINMEKDIKKDLILFGGYEWKEYRALGLANYVRMDPTTLVLDTVTKLQSSEFTFRARWGKNEEFLSGVFDRKSLGSVKFPIFSLQGTFGVKGMFGSDYNYQKIEFNVDHYPTIGILGRLWYNVSAGYVFGKAAYPFLKVHEGSQSFYLYSNAFNKMNFFEFVSDKYVQGIAAIYWNGLLFDRIPLVKKLKWRLVTTTKSAYGAISDRHLNEMLLPLSIKRFGNTPYVEVATGIDNIFKVLRIDLVWRLTHLDPGANPFGVRAKMVINF